MKLSCRSITGVRGAHDNWSADLANFRSAMGMSPLERFNQLQDQLDVVTNMVQEDERRYGTLIAQLRSDQESFQEIISTVDNTTSDSDPELHDGLHAAAAVALQSGSGAQVKKLKGRGIDSLNVVSSRLRP